MKNIRQHDPFAPQSQGRSAVYQKKIAEKYPSTLHLHQHHQTTHPPDWLSWIWTAACIGSSGAYIYQSQWSLSAARYVFSPSIKRSTSRSINNPAEQDLTPANQVCCDTHRPAATCSPRRSWIPIEINATARPTPVWIVWFTSTAPTTARIPRASVKRKSTRDISTRTNLQREASSKDNHSNNNNKTTSANR